MRLRATVALAVTASFCPPGSHAFLSSYGIASFSRAVSIVRSGIENSGDQLSSDGGSAPRSEGQATLTVAVLKAECKARGLKVTL